MKKNRPLKRWLTLWVVEIRMKTRWEPTTGAALTQAEAVHVRDDWRTMNPDDVFRIRPYVRVKGRD